MKGHFFSLYLYNMGIVECQDETISVGVEFLAGHSYDGWALCGIVMCSLARMSS